MKITIKSLQGSQCTVDVTEDNVTDDIKAEVEKQLNIPKENQRLIYKGKTLQDSTALKEYKIKEGDKLHLAVKAGSVTPAGSGGSPNSELETELRKLFKDQFRTEEECNKVLAAFTRILKRRITSLSLDDIERVCDTWSSDNRLHF